MHPSLSARSVAVPVASAILATALAAVPADAAGNRKKAPTDNSRALRDSSWVDTTRRGDTLSRPRAPEWNDTTPGAPLDSGRAVPGTPRSPSTDPASPGTNPRR